MRGGFVACFGDRPTAGTLERAALAHRWHTGTPEVRIGRSLHAALLIDSTSGPAFETSAERDRLVHGAPAGSLSALQREGDRFAAIESDGRELLASRDPMGLCPLFYRLREGALWLATEVAPLLALGPAEPDLTALAAQAALVPYESHTGWIGIFRVLPGWTLHATRDCQLSSAPYWDPSKHFGTYRGTYADAQAEFRARLRKAVDRSAGGRTGILLSGGLDSAAITATAASLGRADCLVHVAFPGFALGDEQRFARAVADSQDLALELVAGDVSRWEPALDLRVTGIPYISWPPLAAGAGLPHLARLGADVALDGNDGDGLLGVRGREWGELVLTGRFRRLGELVRAHGVRLVARSVLDDLVPPAVRLRGLRRRPPTPLTYLQLTERYFGEPLHARMRRADVSRWRQPLGSWRSRQLRQVLPVTTIGMEEHELWGASTGLDMRHPFADRELVEFAVSLPAAVKGDPLQVKGLLLDALRGILPDEILDRPKPAAWDVVARRMDHTRCVELIKGSEVVLPLVNYDRLYRDISQGVDVPLLVPMLLAKAHVFAARG